MKTTSFAVWVCCLCFTVRASDAARPHRLPPEDSSLTDISQFFSAIGAAEDVQVFEGLPHQAFEHELYGTETKRPDLVWIQGYPFYAKPLGVPDDEKKMLTAIVLRKDGHVPFRGVKFCGGYHPDYAVIWTTNGKQSGSLICFGCHEWKNFTPAGRIYEDLGQTEYGELHAILAKYVAQRPGRATKNPEP